MTGRRASACTVLAAACAAYAAQAAPAPHAKAAKHAKPAVAVRAEIVSGTPQSAHAYVEPAAAKYDTRFAQPLVVRVTGTKRAKPGVRFSCVTTGCELPPQEQPDEVKRVDPRTFEVTGKDGKASIALIVSTAAIGTVEVVAEPVAGPGERAVRSAPFVLAVR